MADHGDRIPGDPGELDGIAGLQERLDELRDSVELLRTQGVWNRGPVPEPIPAPRPSIILPPPYDGGRPAPAQPPAPTAPVAPEAPADASPPLPPPPVPAASGTATSVAHVDAGPFADLIELRHFEDDLESLTAVEEVRVRRFGHGRAEIEVGMTGPYDLALELPRLGLPMELAAGPEGELLVEFAPPAIDPADAASVPADERDPKAPEKSPAGRETAA
ncbi:MAG: hypothetical protein U0R51_07255 [Solirubrobacterales bacterium]